MFYFTTTAGKKKEGLVWSSLYFLEMESDAGANTVFVIAVFRHIIMVIDVQSPSQGDVIVDAGLGFREMGAFDICGIGLDSQNMGCSDADAAVKGGRIGLVADVVAPAAEKLDIS